MIITIPEVNEKREGWYGFIVRESDGETVVRHKEEGDTSYARMALKSAIEAMKWCDTNYEELYVEEFVYKGCAYWLWHWVKDWSKCYYHDDLWRQLEPVYSRFGGKLQIKQSV